MEDDIVAKQSLIGEGVFGKVYMAKSKNGGRLLAVKSSSPSSDSLLREEEIIRFLVPCPYVIQCYGGYYSAVEGGRSWVYNLVLEYAPGGTLRNLMRRRGGRLPESKARDYARMIVIGLRYMHEKGVVRCDVKPENVLVCSEENGVGVVQIADFGQAKIDGGEGSAVPGRGTPAYMSPESLGFRQCDPAMDIWSLGCTVIEMVTGQCVWAGCKYKGGIVKRVVAHKQVPKIPENLSESGKDFLINCFERDPKRRWTAQMLLDHEFLLHKSLTLAVKFCMT